jgi:hypothetical protein
MRDLAGPALVEGVAEGPVEFIPVRSEPKAAISAMLDKGRFRVLLPEGNYRVRSHGGEEARTFLPTGVYHLDLRPGRAVEVEMSSASSPDGQVRIKLRARGEGTHRFNLREDNLLLGTTERESNLSRGKSTTLEWSGKIVSLDSPWVVVLSVDGDLSTRKEQLGSAWGDH